MIQIQIGFRVGRLRVIGKILAAPKPTNRGGPKLRSSWICRCDCGLLKLFPSSQTADLRNGKAQSCGCRLREVSSVRLRKQSTKHGMRYTRIYSIWKGMKQRCLDTKTPGYANYGGRGISLCLEWMAFEPFKEWAFSHGYSAYLSIDRIDNDGNYEPANCQWATPKEQRHNQRPRAARVSA